MQFITAAETRAALPIAEAIEACRLALVAQHHGSVAYSEPRMLTLSAPAASRRYRVKAAALPGAGVAGFRLVAGGPSDGSEGVRRVLVLSDIASGAFVAAVDERWCYAIRTAASALIALTTLAPHPLETVGLVGTGVIADAFADVAVASGSVERLVVASRTHASRDAYVERVGRTHALRVEAAPDVATLLEAADAVVLATTATAPLVDARMLRPGSTLYSMGAAELADDVYFACDKLVVDDWEQVQLKPDIARLIASGRLRRATLHAELPAIVAGAVPGRVDPAETIVIRSEGIASMDVAIAHLVAKRVGVMA